MTIKPIQLTQRDLQILQLINRHRLLTTEHILRLVQGSPVMLRRRLTRLQDHQYVAKINQPKPLYYTPGRQASAWGLGKRAHQILETIQHTNWPRRNREASPLLIAHTLLIADIATRFDAAQNPTIRIIDQDDILNNAPRQKSLNPLGWPITFSHKKETNIRTRVVPDRLLALHFPLLPQRQETQYFLLEADTGSEPIERSTIAQGTSIVKKFLSYGASLRLRIPEQRFSLTKSPRILFVSEVPGRVGNMIKAFKRLNATLPKDRSLPANAFLFAATTNLNPHNVLTTSWQNGAGESVVLAKHFSEPQPFLDALNNSSPHERLA